MGIRLGDYGNIADRARLYPRVANASLDHPENFASSVLEVLHDVFPLLAASLYTYSFNKHSLILRAQHGFRYALYKSFTISVDTPAGDAVTSRATIIIPDVR